MKLYIAHRIKRAKQKLYIWASALFDSDFKRVTNSQQSSAYLICRKLIEKEGALLLTAPVSGKRFIKVDDGNMFVIIGKTDVQIINHVYSYTIPMEGHTYIKMINAFDNKLESIRTKMEEDITGNIQKSLKQIKEDLEKNC